MTLLRDNPYQLVPARWSFSFPRANFATASLTVSQGGTAILVTLEPLSSGMGENTLVWRLNAMPDNATWTKPSSDMTYQVTVNNVVVGGVSRSFTYDVIIFAPQVANASEQLPAVSGNAAPAAGNSQMYSFTPVSFAAQHETKLALTSAMQSGKAYWMIYLDGTLNVTMQGTRVTADSQCYFDTVLYANTAKNGENAVGNPYRAAFNWADVRVKVGGSHLTLAVADSNNVLSTSFKRTPNGSSADRNAYSYDTPQTGGMIQPWEAIWVTTKSAFASGTLLSLPAPNP